MALTDRPWRSKSRIMTGSPSLITACLPPASRRTLGDSVRPSGAIQNMHGASGNHENWGNFKCHKWGELLRHSHQCGLRSALGTLRRTTPSKHSAQPCGRSTIPPALRPLTATIGAQPCAREPSFVINRPRGFVRGLWRVIIRLIING